MNRQNLLVRSGAVALMFSGAALLLALVPSRQGSGGAVPLKFSRIYWEYNASANDLGVHVTLDGEDWYKLRIKTPDHRTIFDVRGRRAYEQLGMTELFFEGAEPSLDEFPLEELLAKFPEGDYAFSGQTTEGEDVEGTGVFTHAIPDGPVVRATLGNNDFLRIDWDPVTAPPPGFPNRPLHITGYQVIVEPTFQVTLPASATSVTVSPEFVATLGPGEHLYEVLAIEASGNQTLTEGSFTR